MRYFRNIFFVLAAVLWLPMSVHCQLEKIPALKFLACAADDCADGQDADCEESGCCTAEKTQNKTGQNRVTIPVPDLPPLAIDLTVVAGTAPEGFSFVILSTPPEFPSSWQFVFRVASPPRAPSLAS